MSFSYILFFIILLFIIRRVRIFLFKFSKKETKLDLHVFTMMMMVEITRKAPVGKVDTGQRKDPPVSGGSRVYFDGLREVHSWEGVLRPWCMYSR